MTQHGPLVSLAIGDAYGAGFEYVATRVVKAHNDLSGYHQHPKWTNIKPGSYTDDTQMALAVAELILNHNHNEWSPYNVARAFTDAFRRDPREGYAQGFWDFLKEAIQHDDPRLSAFYFLMNIQPHSDKSGGAMRAGPIGLLPNVQDVIDKAMFQASLTHATRDGMAAAAASALMVHYFHYNLGSKGDLRFILQDVFSIPGVGQVPWNRKVRAPGMDSVKAALTAIEERDTMSGILKRVVDFTGDVDTAAAIALGAASRSQEIEQDLPDVLFEGLEDGDFGKGYLAEIDEELLAKYPARRGTAPAIPTPS